MARRTYEKARALPEEDHYLPRRKLRETPIVEALIVLAIVGLLGLAYWSSRDDTDTGLASERVLGAENDPIPDPADTTNPNDDPPDPDPGIADDPDEPGQDVPVSDPGKPVPIAPPDAGAYLAASVDMDEGPVAGRVVLTGRVPDEETVATVMSAAEVAYGPFAENQIEVDPNVAPSPALAAAPVIVSLLPTVTDGTIMLSDEGIKASVRAISEEVLMRLSGGLSVLSGGLPVEMIDPKISGLEASSIRLVLQDEVLTLTGRVPDEEINQYMFAATNQIHGEGNVINQMEVDPTVAPAFILWTAPGVFQTLAQFGAYDFVLANDRVTGTISEGVSFGLASSEITPDIEELLNIGIAFFVRDPTLIVTVVGHTDSLGDAADNQVLSMERAAAVRNYYAEVGGVDPARVTIDGKGEDEPIASNETDEGRALNRRVEFIFGTDPSLVDGS